MIDDVHWAGYGWFGKRDENGLTISHSGAESALQHFGWMFLYPDKQSSFILLSNSPEEIASNPLSKLAGITLRQ